MKYRKVKYFENILKGEQIDRLDHAIGIYPNPQFFKADMNLQNISFLMSSAVATAPQLELTADVFKKLSIPSQHRFVLTMECLERSPSEMIIRKNWANLSHLILPHYRAALLGTETAGLQRINRSWDDESSHRTIHGTVGYGTYAALFPLKKSGGGFLKAGSSFEIWGWSEIGHGAFDVSICSPVFERAFVILFPDEIKKLNV